MIKGTTTQPYKVIYIPSEGDGGIGGGNDPNEVLTVNAAKQKGR